MCISFFVCIHVFQSGGMFLLRDWLDGYFTVCIYLAKCRKTKMSSIFSPDLTENKPKDDCCNYSSVVEVHVLYVII